MTASNVCKDELRRFRRRLQYISFRLKQEDEGRTGGNYTTKNGETALFSGVFFLTTVR